VEQIGLILKAPQNNPVSSSKRRRTTRSRLESAVEQIGLILKARWNTSPASSMSGAHAAGEPPGISGRAVARHGLVGLCAPFFLAPI
jgi:hypothetical protein